MTVTVGAGGKGGTAITENGKTGGSSSFGELSALGGGGGASYNANYPSDACACSGGAGHNEKPPAKVAKSGGTGGKAYGQCSCGGGGGGMGGDGGDASSTSGGAGAEGVSLDVVGETQVYGSGGGGGVCLSGAKGGSPGANAGAGSTGVANNGVNGFGGGGGGGGGVGYEWYTGKNGGTGGGGAVIVRVHGSCRVNGEPWEDEPTGPKPTVIGIHVAVRQSEKPPVTPDPPDGKLKVSILSDSYSTYLGYIPEGQTTWYGNPNNDNWAKTDVHSVSNTWWHQLTRLIDARILVNNSWSGTTIGNYGYNGEDVSGRSFLSRSNKLHTETEQPDVIVVLGGTNDGWAGAPDGSWKWSDWTTDDLRKFKPALAKLCTDLQANYPRARKVVVVNDYLLSMSSAYSVKLDALVQAAATIGEKAPGLWSSVHVDITGKEGGGHPNTAGMAIIANAVAQAISGDGDEHGGTEGASCDLSNARIAFYDPDPAVHTGSPVTPAVIVSLVTDGVETRLPYGAYTLSYENNTAVGTARVTATGKGDFRGSCSATFTIAADTAQNFAKGEDGRYTACDYANTMTTLSRRGENPTAYKNYAVLGDSYSSWDPRVPMNASGCPYYYPNEDVLYSMSRMWHGYLAKMNGGWQCAENSSFSGGCMAQIPGDEYRSAPDANGKIMYGDAPNRVAGFGKGADIIFVFLGINDLSNVTLGEYKFRNWSNEDLGTFRGAYAYCLKMIRRNNPTSRIICLTWGNRDWQGGYKGGAMAQSVQYITRRMGVECLNLPTLRGADVAGYFVDDLDHHTYTDGEIKTLTDLNPVTFATGERYLNKVELGAMGHPCNIGMYVYADYVNRYLRGEVKACSGVMDDDMDAVDPLAPYAGYCVATARKNGVTTVYRGVVSREIADCERWTLSVSLDRDAPFKVGVMLNVGTRVLSDGGKILATLEPSGSLALDSQDLENWTSGQGALNAMKAYSSLQFIAYPPELDEEKCECVPSFEEMKKYLSFAIRKY